MEQATPQPQAVQVSIGEALGADGGVSVQCFTVYIPNKDKDGREIGTQRLWVLEVIQLLSEINGGATSLPAEGGWLNDDGKSIIENPAVVYSHVKDAARFAESLQRLRAYLHRLGRETNQGEIAFEFGERFFRIRNFDPA